MTEFTTMRLTAVLLLATLQMTAVPFFTVLAAATVRHFEAPETVMVQAGPNVTVVAKSPDVTAGNNQPVLVR